MTSLRWKPIEDLPSDLMKNANTELSPLGEIWKEQSEKLKQSDVIREFHTKLKREWAIETGVIENLYTLDRGTTEILIESGFQTSFLSHDSTNKPPERVISILNDQQQALDLLFDHVSDKRELTVSYIKELHQLLTHHQDKTTALNSLGQLIEIDLIRGDWKKLPNNPKRPDGTIHEYCPPEQVSSEMDRLVENHKCHEELKISQEIQSAWLHHRFTQIHPFQDGNGRVARCLASLVFIKAGWFPLVIHRDQRTTYIAACEEADQGRLSSLIELFANIQKKLFVKALSLSENLLHRQEHEAEVIDSAIQKLLERKRLEKKEQINVLVYSAKLEERTEAKLKKTADQLRDKLDAINTNYAAMCEKSFESNHHWFKRQIVSIAREFDYFADTRTYSKWFRLKIIEERQAEIMICFHSLGVEFLGIMAVSAFIDYRDRDDESGTTTGIDGPYALSHDFFQFSYKEKETDIQNRYEEWLEKVVVAGLDQWRRQL